MAISGKCSGCDSTLSVVSIDTDRSGNSTVVLDPCQTCLENARTDDHDGGYDEGYEKGFEEGRAGYLAEPNE